ncbi:hypothetical protein, partial [Legionella geestiana]
MPGFAALNPAYEKSFKYNNLFENSGTGCTKQTSGQRRCAMPGFATLNPAYKNHLNTIIYLKIVACADKRGTGCAKQTSGLWGYPMPGFATLNPAYKNHLNTIIYL